MCFWRQNDLCLVWGGGGVNTKLDYFWGHFWVFFKVKVQDVNIFVGKLYQILFGYV